jgi:hypothetical protein
MFLGILFFSNTESADMVEKDLKFFCGFLRDGTLANVPNYFIIHTLVREPDLPVQP